MESKSFSNVMFGGFNKEQVITYIDELVECHTTLVTGLQTELDSTKELLATANDNLLRQKELLQRANAKVIHLNETISVVEQSEEVVKTKLKKFETAQYEANIILDNAKNEAELLVNNTQKVVDELLEKSHKESDVITSEAFKSSKVMLDKTKEKVRNIEADIDAKNKQIDNILTQAHAEAQSITARAAREYQLTIQNAHNESDEIIRKSKIQFSDERYKLENMIMDIEANKQFILSLLSNIKQTVLDLDLLSFEMEKTNSANHKPPQDIISKRLSAEEIMKSIVK